MEVKRERERRSKRPESAECKSPRRPIRVAATAPFRHKAAREWKEQLKRGVAVIARTVTMWIRDLTEEGIEPHPGPRYLSKNLNSIHGKNKLYNTFKRIRRESTHTPITALFIQDHRLGPSRAAEIETLARGMKLLAITAHAPPHPRTKICYGGTMIVIPHESIEVEKDETMQDACDRIKATKKAAARGRYLTVTMKVDTAKRKLVAAYAPAKPSDRPAFFNTIAPRLTRRTVLGIDANCVPDTTLDLQRDATTPYRNDGADILSDAVDRKGLIDVVREIKGNEPCFTAHHVVAGGTCWSRIDQIYIPRDGSTHYALGPANDIFPQHSEVEIDHNMVDVRTKKVKPKRGSDTPRISEKIFENATFLEELKVTIQKARSEVHTSRPDGWRKGWEDLKQELKKQCLERT